MKKNFLIVGANFENKGAQSMLFITVDEIKTRVPEAEIYFAGTGVFDKTNYNFQQLYYTEDIKKIALGKNIVPLTIKCIVKDGIKLLLGKRYNLFRFGDAKRLFPNFDLIIDVSGFNIGSKWDTQIQEAYLQNIRLAKKYNIPIILMPQSFGDFAYSDDKAYLLPKIAELLKYPEVIFAREKEGYQMLLKQFHLNNVRLSPDLVLQNTGVKLTNIYKTVPKMKLPYVEKNAVAVIPNKQCFNHGNKEKNLMIYKDLIGHLINAGKKVYVFRHSWEDLSICRMIAERFDGNEVILLDNEFSCFEYDEFVKNFDFIICSRFHGCVHAYRNFVPCILLGWAVKYFELAHNVGQGQYAFDITAEEFNAKRVITAIDNLIEYCDDESEIIYSHIIEIQKHNCFNQIEEWL